MDHFIYLLSPLECAQRGELLTAILDAAAVRSDGEFTAGDLVAAGIAGKLSLMVDSLELPQAVLVADICYSYRKQWLEIVAVAGSLRPFWMNKEMIRIWAGGLGCSEVRLECKGKSRARLFARVGFKLLRQRMYVEV